MTNQCDGCIRGLPLNEYGNHIDVTPGGIFGCTKDRYKKESIGQTVYEQLQEMLIECIDLGWKPFGISKFSVSRGRFMVNNNKSSYHDLFSKDSGLMEVMKWKKEEDAFLIISGKGTDSDVWYHNPKYHYMIMGPMTAEQKIQYFLDNAIIPTPLSE